MSSNSVDTVIHSRWILPVNSHQSILEHHALVINKGSVVDIIPSEEVTGRYLPQKEFDLANHLLMPGMVNAHTHAAMTLLRGYADDYPLQEWLEQHIWPAEGQWVSEEFVRDGSQLAAAEMILSGTTCFSDMYFFPETVAEVVSSVGLRAQLAFPIMEFPTAWGSGPDEYIHKGIELHDKYRHHPNISIAFGPHAPYTVSDDTYRKLVTLAEELQSPIQVHLHETQKEVEDSIHQFGMRPIERLNNLNVLTPLTQCVHMTALDQQDIETISASGAHVVHCPESNLKLASGFTPVAQLQKAGINVALGTDGAASNNDLNMFGEIRTAAMLAKGISQDASELAVHKAIEMATIDGARALGLDNQIGSLEIGKSADVIAIDLSDLSLQPIYNPVSTLVYSCDRNHVTHTWCAGKLLMEDRRLVSLNSSQLRHSTERWQERISDVQK